MDKLRIAKVDNVTLDRLLPPSSSSGTPSPQHQTGTLHLTPHHLIFSPSPLPSSSASTSSNTQDSEEVWISYPSITLLSRLPQTFAGKYPLQIRTRGFESYVLGFERAMEGGAEDVWLSVKDCAVASSVEQLYAFFYKLPPPTSFSSVQNTPTPLISSPLSDAQAPAMQSTSTSSPGWSTFNPRTEFARQGVGSRTKAWRFTDINKDYSYSPTYPAKMVVPSRISDSTLAYAGKYRSKARIPALTYLHWANQASITRSSQPMVGLKNARSAQDERLIECIFASHLFLDTAYNATPTSNPLSQSTSSPSLGPVFGATTTNLIIDARPTTNAMANVAIGAGTENMENYKMAKKAYLGIDNIHVMRNSLKTIQEAIRDSEPLPGQSVGMPLDKALLRKSNWLKHISTILDGSLIIIRNIHLNASHVLIHCSDGWDRTAQLSAVAQICLDPYYRTIDGFKVLIEKDWLAFGHKFLDRSGHLSSEKLFTVTNAPEDESDEELGGGGGAQKAAQAFFASVQKQFNKSSDGHLKEVSPVFHQFLDCVRQIQRQFPDRFEFNEEWLLDIHHHLYSCHFGTFLFNNERERRVAESPKGAYIDRTISAWEWFDRPEIRQKYINESYKPGLDDKDSREPEADQGVVMYDPRDVKFWFRLFQRGDEEMNGPPRTISSQPGADMVIIPPGEVDPVSAEGVLDAIKAAPAGSGDKFVSGPGIDRGPSPRPGAKALDGPSGKNTYRGIESTSSAFSLQTAGHPTPNPDSSSSFPSTGLPTNLNSRQTHASTSGLGSGSGSWGWTQFSSGAISALQRGVKEVRTIGEGAINQIRAEVGEYDGREMAGPGSGTGIGEGRPGAALGRGARLPSEANPWSVPAPAEGSASLSIPGMTTNGYISTAPTSQMRAKGPITSLSRTDNEASTATLRPTSQKQPSWNVNPWGDDARATTSNAQPTPADNGPVQHTSTAAFDGLRHSLSDLKLVEEQRRTQIRANNLGEGKLAAGTEAKKGGQSDKELLDAAKGGDSRAWDPLGAA